MNKDALDHVDGCMDMLGISLNLTDPEGSLSPPSKKYIDEHTATMWNAIKDDYRKLSDAIHALREDTTEQKILDIIQEATERANKVSETFAQDNMDAALDDIEQLCKEQLEKGNNTNG
jgi:chemotaxis regulatin CheY-phosphate phosphatase CheZ